MWNPVTNKIILTRDVLFLRKSYGDWIEEKESQAKQDAEIPISMLKRIEIEDSGDEGTRVGSQLLRRVSSSESETSNQDSG